MEKNYHVRGFYYHKNMANFEAGCFDTYYNISFQSAQLFLSRALRFEDFTLDMVRKAEELFDFMNLKLQPVSQDFIYKATHPNTTQDLPHNVHIRDPATVVSKWWKKLSMPEVKKIQSNCKEAMELWGYMPIKNYNAKHELFDTGVYP